jgi:hypothetical protein
MLIMKLTDLDPPWLVLEDGGPRLGLTFHCPHCPQSGQRLAVVFHHRGQEAVEDGYILAKHGAADTNHIWTEDGADFDTLTLTPSVDASGAGHWHGFVTAGQIVGGI